VVLPEAVPPATPMMKGAWRLNPPNRPDPPSQDPNRAPIIEMLGSEVMTSFHSFD
jgi:hypothetical protein